MLRSGLIQVRLFAKGYAILPVLIFYHYSTLLYKSSYRISMSLALAVYFSWRCLLKFDLLIIYEAFLIPIDYFSSIHLHRFRKWIKICLFRVFLHFEGSHYNRIHQDKVFCPTLVFSLVESWLIFWFHHSSLRCPDHIFCLGHISHGTRNICSYTDNFLCHVSF